MDKRSAVISALFEKKNKRKPKNSQELQDFIKSQGGDEFLKKVDEYIEQAEKEQAKQAQKAEHGTKLQYLKSLKNKCNEDEELVYYKKGGSVKCGCKKKEEGGEINKTKSGNPIERFKAKKASLGDILTRIADATGSQGGFKNAQEKKKAKKSSYQTTTPDKNGEYTDNRGNIIITKKGMEERTNNCWKRFRKRTRKFRT